MNILNEIKYAYQRVVRGYDETLMWDLDTYFEQIVPPLKAWCEERVADKEFCRLNPKHAAVFTETLRLIAEYEKMTPEQEMDIAQSPAEKLFEFVGRNLRGYWD